MPPPPSGSGSGTSSSGAGTGSPTWAGRFFSTGRGNAPLAAFTMAVLLTTYCLTSMRSAKHEAQLDRLQRLQQAKEGQQQQQQQRPRAQHYSS